MRTTLILILNFFISFILSAQSIFGTFTGLRNQPIRLEGFDGLRSYVIASGQADAEGRFRLSYNKADYGMGYLMAGEGKPLFVLLSGEEVVLEGESLQQTDKLRVLKGRENQWFEQYAKEQPRREHALSAWDYLEKLYARDSLFLVQKTPVRAIAQEKLRIRKEDSEFLAALPKQSYVSWFLPVRKLVSNVSTVAQYRTEEIPATIAAFRALDYTDPRLYKSGLFKDAIDNHFWLLENSGKPLDSVFAEMRTSIDGMLRQLMKEEKKLNEVADHLFDLLERHSLFQASEHLALKVLNEVSCTVNSDLAKQLEIYRAMKKGNTAADLDFSGNKSTFNISALPKKLSEFKSPYTLVAFAAGWCEHCRKEIPQIVPHYEEWKKAGMEVVLISLDDQPSEYQAFAQSFPFPQYCDFKKWESEPAKSYYVFGTPTFFLLDQDRKIVLRPNSVNQVKAWVDWFLLKKQ